MPHCRSWFSHKFTSFWQSEINFFRTFEDPHHELDIRRPQERCAYIVRKKVLAIVVAPLFLLEFRIFNTNNELYFETWGDKLSNKVERDKCLLNQFGYAWDCNMWWFVTCEGCIIRVVSPCLHKNAHLKKTPCHKIVHFLSTIRFGPFVEKQGVSHTGLAIYIK
jgi:hypothetical protein